MPRSNGSKTTTRRRLLAGSAAEVAVVAVDAVMPAIANAADGDNLKIGQENTAANTTRLSSMLRCARCARPAQPVIGGSPSRLPASRGSPTSKLPVTGSLGPCTPSSALIV